MRMRQTQTMADLMNDGVQTVATEMQVGPGGRGRIEVSPDLVLIGGLMITQQPFADLGFPPNDVGFLNRVRRLEPCMGRFKSRADSSVWACVVIPLGAVWRRRNSTTRGELA